MEGLSPVRICVLYDNTRGFCARSVRELARLLEQRAFIVTTHDIADGPLSLEDYTGVVVGSPVFGLGLRGVGPTHALTRFIADLTSLEGRQVAIFCVYATRPGNTLERMRHMLDAKGANLVVEQAFWVAAPKRDAHVIPTECMVRMR